MLIIVATGVGGVKSFLNNVKKNCTFLARRLPLEEAQYSAQACAVSTLVNLFETSDPVYAIHSSFMQPWGYCKNIVFFYHCLPRVCAATPLPFEEEIEDLLNNALEKKYVDVEYTIKPKNNDKIVHNIVLKE